MRPLFAFGFFVAAIATAGVAARADDARMLGSAQLVSLLVKAVDYDRHFAARANGRVHTLVVYRDGDIASVSTAHDLVTELQKSQKIGGFVHDEHSIPFENANALAAQIRSEQIAIVIISRNLSSEASAIAHALDGIDTLSVAVDPDDVSQGIVLGFDARNGKSTLMVRLAQARRQNVAFEASLLRLARIE